MFSFFRQNEYWYGGALCWNLPHGNSDHRGSFWKSWPFCIFSPVPPLCSADIPLKWVPSYCRCCVQISSCLWLRRKTRLKENNELMGLFIIIISFKWPFFFFFHILNKKVSTTTNRTWSCLVSPYKNTSEGPAFHRHKLLTSYQSLHTTPSAPTLLWAGAGS